MMTFPRILAISVAAALTVGCTLNQSERRAAMGGAIGAAGGAAVGGMTGVGMTGGALLGGAGGALLGAVTTPSKTEVHHHHHGKKKGRKHHD